MNRETKNILTLSKAEVTIACEDYGRKHNKVESNEKLELVELITFSKDNTWLGATITEVGPCK